MGKHMSNNESADLAVERHGWNGGAVKKSARAYTHTARAMQPYASVGHLTAHGNDARDTVSTGSFGDRLPGTSRGRPRSSA